MREHGDAEKVSLFSFFFAQIAQVIRMLRSQGKKVPDTYEAEFRRVRLLFLFFVDKAGGPQLLTPEGVGSTQPQDRAAHALSTW
jgi:hypothetical protein